MQRNRKTSRTLNLGINETARETNLTVGDSDRNYAGASDPRAIHEALREAVVNMETPETLMEDKERWVLVKAAIHANLKTRPHLDMLMDHFEGLTYRQLEAKYELSSGLAHYWVAKCYELLQSKFANGRF